MNWEKVKDMENGRGPTGTIPVIFLKDKRQQNSVMIGGIRAGIRRGHLLTQSLNLPLHQPARFLFHHYISPLLRE